MKEMDELPLDIIYLVSSFLDDFQTQRLAFVCKSFNDILYNDIKLQQCSQTIVKTKEKLGVNLNTITRIGSNGVIHGECEDCGNEGLLYESLNPHPHQQSTKWICLEMCKFTCLTCDTVILSKSRNGWHDPIMCYNCFTRINTFIWD